MNCRKTAKLGVNVCSTRERDSNLNHLDIILFLRGRGPPRPPQMAPVSEDNAGYYEVVETAGRATPGEMVSDNKVTVKGLTEGKPYEFRVAAVNEAGPGAYAETKEAIKPAPAPSTFS